MYNRDKIARDKLGYKIQIWFYNLTKEDIKFFFKRVLTILNDFLIVIFGIIILLFLPAFLH